MDTALHINEMKSLGSVRKIELNSSASTKTKGISGAKVDEDGWIVEREGLQEMLADLESQKVTHVIVLNTSRFGVVTWRKC